MNVEIGAEAALFPEKEYIKIFVAVHAQAQCPNLERFKGPRKRFQGIDSISLRGLAESIPGVLKRLQIRTLVWRYPQGSIANYFQKILASGQKIRPPKK
jgi:hypothetical protein